MSKTNTTDPRAQFAGTSDANLRCEAADLRERRDRLRLQVENRRPTREDVASEVARLQASARTRFDSNASQGLRQFGTAVPGSPGYLSVENMVMAYVLSSDALADALTQSLSASRPSEADLAPAIDECKWMTARADAIDAELRLRDLDSQRESEERERAAISGTLDAALAPRPRGGDLPNVERGWLEEHEEAQEKRRAQVVREREQDAHNHLTAQLGT